ncbi:MAG: hypothetical protein Q4E05_10270, partial [Pseudoclavibacter sp.]|nr:hypothetical protein [Pseudoclavibacter sp.]
MSKNQNKGFGDKKAEELQGGYRKNVAGLETLMEGAAQLWDGAQTLRGGRTEEEKRRGRQELWDGAVKTKDGAIGVADGTMEILGTSKAPDQLRTGVDEAMKGGKSLSEGLPQLWDGATAAKDGRSEQERQQGRQDMRDGAAKAVDGVIGMADAGLWVLGDSKEPGRLRTGVDEGLKSREDLSEGLPRLWKGAGQVEDALQRGVAESLSRTPDLTKDFGEMTARASGARGNLGDLARELREGDVRGALGETGQTGRDLVGTLKEGAETVGTLPELGRQLRGRLPDALVQGWRDGSPDLLHGAGRTLDGVLHIVDGAQHVVNQDGPQKYRKIFDEGMAGSPALREGTRRMAEGSLETGIGTWRGIAQGMAETPDFGRQAQEARRSLGGAAQNLGDLRDRAARGDVRGMVGEAAAAGRDVRGALGSAVGTVGTLPELAGNVVGGVSEHARDGFKGYLGGLARAGDGALHVADATLHAVLGGEGRQLRDGGRSVGKGASDMFPELKKQVLRDVGALYGARRGVEEAVAETPGFASRVQETRRSLGGAAQNLGDLRDRAARGDVRGMVGEAAAAGRDVRGALGSAVGTVGTLPELAGNIAESVPEHTRRMTEHLPKPDVKRYANGGLYLLDGVVQMIGGNPETVRTATRELRTAGQELQRGRELFHQSGRTLAHHVDRGIRDGIAKTPGLETDIRQAGRAATDAGRNLFDAGKKLLDSGGRGGAEEAMREGRSALGNISTFARESVSIAGSLPEAGRNLAQTVPDSLQKGLKQSGKELFEGGKQTVNGVHRAGSALKKAGLEIAGVIPQGKMAKAASSKAVASAVPEGKLPDAAERGGHGAKRHEQAPEKQPGRGNPAQQQSA